MPTNGNEQVSILAEHVEGAEAFKDSAKDSPEHKARTTGKAFLSAIGKVEDIDEDKLASLKELVDSITVDSTGFDKAEGDLAAEAVEAFIALTKNPATADLAGEGFDVDEATEMLNRWKEATRRGGRGAATGDYKGTNADTPCPIRVTFDVPDGHEDKVPNDGEPLEHDSTWSSVSAEITKVAQKLNGLGRGEGYKRPSTTSEEWRAAVKSIREGGNGGVIHEDTEAGPMTVTVEAVR